MYLHYKNIFLHKSVLYVTIAFVAVSDVKLYIIALASIFLHELAHYTTAKLCGAGDMHIYIYPTGCRLNLKKNCKYEELVYCSGPTLSLIIAAAGYFTGYTDILSINLKIALLNMLPALPLDGGMLIRVIIWKNYGIYYGTKISRILTLSTIVFLTAWALLQKNLWLLFIAGLLLAAPRQKPIPFCVKKPDAKIKVFTVEPDCSLLKITRFLSSYYYTMIRIKSQAKLISEEHITEYIKAHGMDGSISDIF